MKTKKNHSLEDYAALQQNVEGCLSYQVVLLARKLAGLWCSVNSNTNRVCSTDVGPETNLLFLHFFLY